MLTMCTMTIPTMCSVWSVYVFFNASENLNMCLSHCLFDHERHLSFPLSVSFLIRMIRPCPISAPVFSLFSSRVVYFMIPLSFGSKIRGEKDTCALCRKLQSTEKRKKEEKEENTSRQKRVILKCRRFCKLHQRAPTRKDHLTWCV